MKDNLGFLARRRLARELPIKQDYLIRNYLKELCALPLPTLKEGYKKECADLFLHDLSYMGINREKYMNMTVGMFAVRLDKYLSQDFPEDEGVSLLLNYILSFVGYPHKGFHEDKSLDDYKGAYNIMANYTRISVAALMDTCGKMTESSDFSILKNRQLGIFVHDNDDVGLILEDAADRLRKRLNDLEMIPEECGTDITADAYTHSDEQAQRNSTKYNERLKALNIIRLTVIAPLLIFAEDGRRGSNE